MKSYNHYSELANDITVILQNRPDISVQLFESIMYTISNLFNPDNNMKVISKISGGNFDQIKFDENGLIMRDFMGIYLPEDKIVTHQGVFYEYQIIQKYNGDSTAVYLNVLLDTNKDDFWAEWQQQPLAHYEHTI